MRVMISALVALDKHTDNVDADYCSDDDDDEQSQLCCQHSDNNPEYEPVSAQLVLLMLSSAHSHHCTSLSLQTSLR